MLDLFITSKTRRKIITVFSKYPDLHTHVRGLAKMVREDAGNVQRELARLERVGFLKSARAANTRVYSANLHFVLYRELQGLVLKSQAHRRTMA